MGDPKGPTYGWSALIPTQQGWYEVATEREIESENPVVTRIWADGKGGTFAPAEIRKSQARSLGIKRRAVVQDKGGTCVVFLPVYGSFAGSYFRALGPILKGQPNPEPQHIPKFQRPETYLTPEQRRSQR